MVENHYFRHEVVNIGSIFIPQMIQRAQLAAHVSARGRQRAGLDTHRLK